MDCWFLSRRAAEAHYCERSEDLCAAARHNFATLGAADIKIHPGDGVAWLHEQSGHFDLIYLDPARRDLAARRVYDIADCEPNLLEIKPLLLEKADRVLAKISPMADIARTLAQIPEIRELHIVAVGGEVKELLLLLEPQRDGSPHPKPQIVAADGDIRFTFTPDEEPAAAVHYAERVGRYLYQPAKALLKAGAFRLLSERFGLAKLAPSTHLYTSDEAVKGFPGKCFSVEEVLDWSKASQRLLRECFDRMEMTALNFPIGTDTLRERLGIAGGGDRHLFAITLSDKKKQLILCQP